MENNLRSLFENRTDNPLYNDASNNRTNDTFETLIQSLLQQNIQENILPSRSIRPNPFEQSFQRLRNRTNMQRSTQQQYEPQNIPRNNQVRNRILNVLTTILYDYNRNIQEYQHTINSCIQLLNQMSAESPTYENAHIPEFRNNVNIPAAAETPTDNENSTLLFSYTFYPPFLTGNQNETIEPLNREEIARTTRTYGYTEDMLQNNSSENNTCPISLETFTVGDVLCEIRGCGHIFKRPPLMNWFRNHNTCPVCRYNVRNYQSDATNEPISRL